MRLHREFFRNGPNFRDGQDVSFRDIVNRFQFYRIKIGRWVTPAEEQRSANLFYDALCDLQHILAVPPIVLSMQGAVALSFGSGGRPGASAHYQPAGRVLALAKNAGGGSLAHEWFHAFDHYIGPKLFGDTVYARGRNEMLFASRAWLMHNSYVPHPLNQLLHSAYKALFLTPDGNSPNAYVRHCQAFDKASGYLYYGLPEELAARAFENGLQRLQLKNHFLVSGTLQSDTAQAGLYPSAELSSVITTAFLRYFAQLGTALENSFAEVKTEKNDAL